MIRTALKYGAYSTGGLIGVGCALHPEEAKHVPVGALRFGRAAKTVCSIVIDYKKNLFNGTLSQDSHQFKTLKSEIHLRSAVKLLDLCCTNGGTFVKIGQHIGSLEYLLPQEYVSTLSVLHSKAPTSSIEDVKLVIKQELGKECSEIFKTLDENPVGAASLAQVHLGETFDGRKLAVKVQHKTVKELANIDMMGMEFLVNVVSKVFPDFQFDWLVNEMKINLPLELDFEHEGRNAERVSDMFKHLVWLKVPYIEWDFTTKRVLTMEFCEGGQVNDPKYMKKHGISPQQVSERLGLLYSEMIFVKGYVHCDPHPGNVLVKKQDDGSAQIVLLDHGLYANLTDSTRHNYSQLWLSILSSDVKKIIHYGKELGVGDLAELFACMVTARSWDSISKGISKKKMDDAERAEVSEYAVQLVPQIIQTLGRVNRQVLLLLKTNDLLRGIESSLNIEKSERSFLTMSRCCLISEHKFRISQCMSFYCRLKCLLSHTLDIIKVDAVQVYLNIIQMINSWMQTVAIL